MLQEERLALEGFNGVIGRSVVLTSDKGSALYCAAITRPLVAGSRFRTDINAPGLALRSNGNEAGSPFGGNGNVAVSPFRRNINAAGSPFSRSGNVAGSPFRSNVNAQYV